MHRINLSDQKDITEDDILDLAQKAHNRDIENRLRKIRLEAVKEYKDRPYGEYKKLIALRETVQRLTGLREYNIAENFERWFNENINHDIPEKDLRKLKTILGYITALIDKYDPSNGEAS